jgi:DNA-binding transcriptional ArsR family regulator
LVSILQGALGGPDSIQILLFLHREAGPVMTKDIMGALEIRNWSTTTTILRRLEEAKLVTVEEMSVGRYKSRAKFWRVEQKFGVKVAAALEEVERLGAEAASYKPPTAAGRPGMVDIESSGEKLVMMVQHAVQRATGSGGP